MVLDSLSQDVLDDFRKIEGLVDASGLQDLE